MLPMSWPTRSVYRRMVDMFYGKENGRRWARDEFAALRAFREWRRLDDQVRIFGRYEGNVFCEELPQPMDPLWKAIMSNNVQLTTGEEE